MIKILGYLIAIVGIIGVAIWAIPQFHLFAESFMKEFTNNNSYKINDNVLLIVSGAIVLVGIFLIIKVGGGRGKAPREVPIFHGKNVVGYRRH